MGALEFVRCCAPRSSHLYESATVPRILENHSPPSSTLLDMEQFQSFEMNILQLPEWPFIVWWLVLFASSYLLHSARAVLIASIVEGCRRTECYRSGQSNIKHTTRPFNQDPAYIWPKYITVLSVLFTIFHLLILAILVYVLLAQIRDGLELFAEAPDIYMESGEDDESKTESMRKYVNPPTHHEEDENSVMKIEISCAPGAGEGHSEASVSTEESDPGYVSQDQVSETSSDESHTTSLPEGDEAQEENPTICADKPPSKCYEYRIVIDDSHFGLLRDDVKLALAQGGYHPNPLVEIFVHEIRPELLIQLCGYAIFKRNETWFRNFAGRKSILKRWPTYFLEPSESSLQEFVDFAIERQYHDILAALYDKFPWITRIRVRKFGTEAVHHGSLAQLDIVWRYLENDTSFLRGSFMKASWSNQNEVLLYIIRTWVERGKGEIEDALRAAICHRSLSMVRFWLQHNVDPRKTVDFREGIWRESATPRSALFLAAAQGDVEIMAMLLDKDAEVHPGEAMVPVLLETALSEFNYGVAELLLARGADILEVSLDTAVASGWRENTLKILLQSGRRDFHSPLYGTVLQRACTQGNLEAAHLLLEYGHEINPKSPMALGGNSPLMGAISAGHVDLVRFLISRGALVHSAQSVFGNALQTAVHICHGLGVSTDLIHTLLDHVIFVDFFILPRDIRNRRFYQTPLALAIDYLHDEVAKILLERGASEALLSDKQRQALHKMPKDCQIVRKLPKTA